MLTNGQELRQFLHADDCCECLNLLANLYPSLNKEKEYHITNFQWTSILDVANIINKFLPCKINPAKNEIDEVQMGSCNQPNNYILQFWKPSIDLESGIKRCIDDSM